ncbi:Dabb family protein [Paenibacillus jilunlii]|uniref:Stress responsive A/B Barrel Domain n=1 Tax=Paenibacillus jilunlii TaxID=682956 RepID=A0A1G9G6R3_9BACL|nr:Dabb family protein [Paenibacillus jilunlii]KWX71361.1 stress responsive protein [Paenibacillus jilunlii]SDK96292.1 Stress responsive A/B Barrel Domain [Paenibacillus jilunlii]
MIKHIVFFKLKDRTPEKIQETVAVLRNMEGKIPQLLSIEAGADIIRSERSFDIALVTVVASLDDLQAYQVHPEHKKVIAHINEVKEVSFAVDYEI